MNARRAPDRIVGLDVARCLALLGMVATHLVDTRGPGGELTFAHALAGGRASALFAVLAGVSLALMTGGREPVVGRERWAVSGGLLVRALLIALLGLALGGLGSGIAVILTYYGVLFVLGLPFLGLGARPLLALAGCWVVVGPVLSHLVRPHLPARGVESPTFGQLADPGRMASELLFTGYYPVVPWLAYLLVGMALGRLDLRSLQVQRSLTVVGAVLAVGAIAASQVLTRSAYVSRALLENPPSEETLPQLLDGIAAGMYGTTPTGGAWQWLLVVAPHSATPFDLAQTIGSALLVIGLVLLVVRTLPASGEAAVGVAFGAGRMTLTLYSLHVVMPPPEMWPDGVLDSFGWQLLVLLGIGAMYAAAGRRGPLEWAVTATVRAVQSPRTLPRSDLV